jgi:hypothetical protein
MSLASEQYLVGLASKSDLSNEERHQLVSGIEGAFNEIRGQKEAFAKQFTVGVAARKWQDLQNSGYRMKSIAFSDDVRSGAIDTWGRVAWDAPSNQMAISNPKITNWKLVPEDPTPMMLEAGFVVDEKDVLDVNAGKPNCWCTTCRPISLSDMRFVVCPECGNKRCPKAHNHQNKCTNSNEVGQVGSSWEDVKAINAK